MLSASVLVLFYVNEPRDENHYCPTTMLREGNVFTGVCVSVCPHGGPRVTITHDALDLTVQALSCRHGTPHPYPLPVTSGGRHWKPVQMCSLHIIV